MKTDWEFDNEAGTFEPVLHNQYLYPALDLQPGNPERLFGGSPQLPG